MDNELVGRLYERCVSWIDEDLSVLEEEKRIELYEIYRWMFSSDCSLVSLESLIAGNDSRVCSFRDKFKDWFYVVCDYSLAPQSLGKTSSSRFMYHPYWGKDKRRRRLEYAQKVILVLGMTGIFTGLKSNYSHSGTKGQDHGRAYEVDISKLAEWTSTSTGQPDVCWDFTAWSLPVDDSWVCSSSDDEFDDSYLKGSGDGCMDDSWTQHNVWFSQRQYETISSLSVKSECVRDAELFLESNPYQVLKTIQNEDKKKEKAEKKLFRSRFRNCDKLIDIYKHNVGRCVVDDKGGRFYSIMVGLGRDYRRNCLLMDGERIVEVDVSSSQPTQIGVKILLETGKKTEWLSHCLEGDFYEWVKRLTGVRVKRDRVKKYVMHYLYSCYDPDKMKEAEELDAFGIDPYEDKDSGSSKRRGYKWFEGKISAYLEENEPEIFALIEKHKSNPVWNDKVWKDKRGRMQYGKYCSTLPVEMQKIEVEYIQTCLSRIPEHIKFYTIHDAICVKESDGEVIKGIMEQVSLDLYGEKIAVKIENV